MKKKIPVNQEHVEAREAELHRAKEQIVKKMSPKERVKMKAIDKAVDTLEKAGVPYNLFASTDLDFKKLNWWDFNRFSYSDDFEHQGLQNQYALSRLMPTALRVCSAWFPGCTIVVYDTKNKKAMAFYENGTEARPSEDELP